MNTSGKQLRALAAAFAIFFCGAVRAAHDPGAVAQHINAIAPINEAETGDSPKPGEKKPFIIKRGDCELTIGGKAKIEHFFQRNVTLLNRNLPDEFQFFKETIDLTLDLVYGKEKYGYKAVELFTDMRHKGIWGKASSFADRDAGPIGPSFIRFSQKDLASFGSHSHGSGKPLIWFKDAWLQFSPNAVADADDEHLHYLKLGWFPFDMGRGIAFGGFYGLNKELLGLYSYAEDKAAPGINLNGVLVKDRLTYDLYYARFEERSRSFTDTIGNFDKRQIVGHTATPWRGTAKNDEAIAGRLKWKALKKHVCGDLEFEPYIFYNAASDQRVENAPDGKTKWGSYGMAFEHAYDDFEFGGEVAFNYGKEQVFNIDRNQAQVLVNNATGNLVEQFSYILDTTQGVAPTYANALVTKASVLAAQSTNVAQTAGAMIIVNGMPTQFINAPSRFRPAYTNKLAGWMTVVDGAYTFEPWNLKLAVAYGYASGDVAPHANEISKTYNGFVGLHELYSGKRVKSILFLDERSIRRPVSLDPSDPNSEGGRISASQDVFFSDLQHVGIGATWSPNYRIKDLSINPNIIGFWKAHTANKFIPNYVTNANGIVVDNSTISSTETARDFLGTEINVLSQCSLLKDLKLFANFAMFLPGGFFTDMKGVKVGSDPFDQIIADEGNDFEIDDSVLFRLSDDVAYHLNIGFEYKF